MSVVIERQVRLTCDSCQETQHVMVIRVDAVLAFPPNWAIVCPKCVRATPGMLVVPPREGEEEILLHSGRDQPDA